jgi:hypothetical protein
MIENMEKNTEVSKKTNQKEKATYKPNPVHFEEDHENVDKFLQSQLEKVEKSNPWVSATREK